MKKNISVLLLTIALGSMACTSKVKKEDHTAKVNMTESAEIDSVKATFSTNLRPNESIFLNQTYTDTIEFLSYEDDFDYAMLIGKKNGKGLYLIYDWYLETNEKYIFKYGDLIEVKWKMDSIIIDCEETFDVRERIIDSKLILATNKPVKFLWRAVKDDKLLDQKDNDMIINESFCKSITNQEKVALGYVASFIGNDCFWDGKANEDRSNLKCKILTALNLGYQCSDTHYGFLKRWFSQDSSVLKKLEVCHTMPETATVQTTFNEIIIFTDKAHKKIEVRYKIQGINMRESKTWNYTKTDYFKYDSNNVWLTKSQKSELTE